MNLFGALAALRCVCGAGAWAILMVSASGTVSAATVTVQVAPQGAVSFSPSSVSIQPGDTVQWVWRSNSMPHSVTSNGGLFDSGVHQSNTFTFSHTFPAAGTFPYFCTVHPIFMKGTVIVVASSPKLSNISTRASVQTGSGVTIGGFIVTGTASKSVVVRGLGPTLTQFNVTGVLADPFLSLVDGSGNVIWNNDNWKDSQQTAIQATGLAPPNDLESAILQILQPGNYTAILSGKNGTTGVGLVEVYDTNIGALAELTNVSTRGFVGTGQGVMIGGIITSGGNGSTQIVVRGLGPSLTQLGVAGALADPVVTLVDNNGNVVSTNNNWKNTQQAAIQATGLAPPNDLEAAILVTVTTGHYTAILSGNAGGTGIGLVEVYALQ